MNRQKHAPFIVILLLSLAIRLYLSGWNSYWYDELLSVVRFGIEHDNVSSMIDHLANGSVHPPLYQIVLYYWMQLFGDSEVSTRLLSNIYVTGATIFIYLLIQHIYNRRLAIFTSVLFVLAYDPIFFALEARSYAQTLFLSTVSSYLFYRMVLSGTGVRSRWFWVLFPVNLALLMTHYYNGIFIVVQGAFTFFYSLHRNKKLDVLTPLNIVLVPVLTFLVLWGPRMLARYQVRENNPNSTATEPISIFLNQVFANINPYLAIIYPLVLGLWIFLVIEAILMLRRRRKLNNRQYFYLYLLAQLTLIPIGAYMMTFIGQFSWRYIVYFAPPLMMLIAVLFEQTVTLLNRVSSRRIARSYLRNAPVVITIMCLILVLPAGYMAAVYQKDPWREVAYEIIHIIHNDPEHTYLVYETGPGSIFLDYYFARWDDSIHVTNAIDRGVGTEAAYNRLFDEGVIAGADFMIVFFMHDGFDRHRFVLDHLCRDYHFYFNGTLDEQGYIIFDLNERSAGNCPVVISAP